MDKRTREAVRYLGYGKHAIDERVLEMIQECFTELEQVSNAKFIYRIFEVSKMNEEELAIGYIKIKSRNLSKNFLPLPPPFSGKISTKKELPRGATLF